MESQITAPIQPVVPVWTANPVVQEILEEGQALPVELAWAKG